MRKKAAMAQVGFKVALAYRFNFLITLFITPITLIVFYFLWKSIFEYSGVEVIKGFTFEMMITYYALNMIVAFFTWSQVDDWIEESIIDGNLIFQLLQPINFLSRTYFFELGINLLAVLLEAIPLFLIGFIFFGLSLASPINLALFIVSVFLASLIFFMISYLIGLTAFWLKRISGLRRMKKPVVSFLAGGLIPLTFFPPLAQKVLAWLPFQYIRYVPISIYLGRFTLIKNLYLILAQLGWVLVLLLLSNLVWKRAYKKFAGAGA